MTSYRNPPKKRLFGNSVTHFYSSLIDNSIVI